MIGFEGVTATACLGCIGVVDFESFTHYLFV
jgi:hypothetical protein